MSEFKYYTVSPAYDDRTEDASQPREDMTLEHTKQLYHILGSLEGIDPHQLRKVAAELVGRGGEYTACGRCLERAIEVLYPDTPKPVERKIGFEEGYGGMTLPFGGKRHA